MPNTREKLIELPVADAILILKEELKQRTDGYTTYLANGGKGDPAEEVNLDALAMAISALEQKKWIPVTERLPEDDLPKGSKVKQIKVLTTLKSDKGVRTVRSQMRYRMTWYNSAPWAWKYSGSEITHWMPLPEAPKGE